MVLQTAEKLTKAKNAEPTSGTLKPIGVLYFRNLREIDKYLGNGEGEEVDKVEQYGQWSECHI